jgi:hypothetical protein
MCWNKRGISFKCKLVLSAVQWRKQTSQAWKGARWGKGLRKGEEKKDVNLENMAANEKSAMT